LSAVKDYAEGKPVGYDDTTRKLVFRILFLIDKITITTAYKIAYIIRSG